MSELINTHDNHATMRWKLLTGVSALALAAYVSSTNVAKSEESGQPTLLLELGAQTELLKGTASPFIAPFMTVTPTPSPFVHDSPIDNQRPSRFAFGGDGKISFRPEDFELDILRQHPLWPFAQQCAFSPYNDGSADICGERRLPVSCIRL